MNQSSILLPAAVLCLFGLLLPAPLPRASSGPSHEVCLTLIENTAGTRVPPQVAELERCASLYPRDVELLADLGDAYERAEAPRRAEATYRRALRIDPGYAELRLRLGQLLLRRGAPAEARHEAVEGLRVQPGRDPLVALLRDAEGALAQGRR